MPLWLGFNLWFEAEEGVALSVWRVALLQAVADTGSISGAAQRMGVQYRVAWQKIHEMEARLGVRLVLGQTGGVGGGGAKLTSEAEELVRRFRTLSDGLAEHIRAVATECFPEFLEKDPACADEPLP